jgi:hypothetical protein
MSTQRLTPFQSAAEDEIVRALEAAARSVERREVLSGSIPVYSKEPQTVVHIVTDGLQVWLWGDEAHLLHNGEESRFDQPDFDSTDELREALLDEIRSRLVESRK